MKVGLGVVFSAILWVGAWAQEEGADGRIDRLIQDLGANEYPTREAAEQELVKIGAAAVPALKKALEDPDAERADRARRILEKLEKEPERNRPRRSASLRSTYRDLSRGLTVLVEDGRIEVTIPEKDEDGGKKVYKTYKADSIEEFKERYPEIAKEYDIEQVLPRVRRGRGMPEDFNEWWRTWEKELNEDWFKEWRLPLDRDLGKWLEEHRRLLDELSRRRWELPGERQERSTPTQGREFGLKIEPVGETLAAQFDLAEGEGVQVAEVKPGSRAEKAGLKKHDVIVKFDGKAITDKWEFRKQVRETLARGFELEVIRGGKRETVQVKGEE
ncbi:MAG: PDZ domain-containing protein [Planctomycetes bacterium]|nr:PDZ domain-containing protein [Planctomycetota bacterium]